MHKITASQSTITLNWMGTLWLLLWIQDVVNKVAQYNIYSFLDLKSAYHQINLNVADRKYTVCEANGQLFQITMPFGIKNALPCFQHIINEITEKTVAKEHLLIWTMSQWQVKLKIKMMRMSRNVLSIAREYDITQNKNKNKCICSSYTIDLLGYRISNGKLQPDPQRTKPKLFISCLCHRIQNS